MKPRSCPTSTTVAQPRNSASDTERCRHRRARWDRRPGRPLARPQQRLRLVATRQPNRAGEAAQDHRVRRRLGDERDARQRRQALVEAGARGGVVERGDEVGLDATVEQRAKRRLRGDDDDLLPHRRVRQEVRVPRQRRTRRDAHGGPPRGGVLQRLGRRARRVDGQVLREVPAGPLRMHHRGREVRPGRGGHRRHVGAEAMHGVGVQPPGHRVRHQPRPLRERNGVRIEPRSSAPPGPPPARRATATGRSARPSRRPPAAPPRAGRGPARTRPPGRCPAAAAAPPPPRAQARAPAAPPSPPRGRRARPATSWLRLGGRSGSRARPCRSVSTASPPAARPARAPTPGRPAPPPPAPRRTAGASPGAPPGSPPTPSRCPRAQRSSGRRARAASAGYRKPAAAAVKGEDSSA